MCFSTNSCSYGRGFLCKKTFLLWRTNHSWGHMRNNAETACLGLWLASGAVSTSKEAVQPTLSAVQQSGLNNIKPSVQIPFSEPSYLNWLWKIESVGASCDLVNHANSQKTDSSPTGKRTKSVNKNRAWTRSPPSQDNNKRRHWT